MKKIDHRFPAMIQMIQENRSLGLSDLAKHFKLSSGRIRTILDTNSRKLDLSGSIIDIKKTPNLYLQKVEAQIQSEQIFLSSDLFLLSHKLGIKQEQINSEYLSNLTPSQLLKRGISLSKVSDLQITLQQSNKSLKRCTPQTPQEIREVKRAIALLNAFYFDTSTLEEAYQKFITEDYN
mgnify:CR=1 FL=1